MELTSENVGNILHECLFDDHELPNGNDTKPEEMPAGTIFVDGVINRFGLKGAVLEQHREDVKSMIEQLKPEFFPNTGGGYSFLGLPFTKDDKQWGEHINAEALYVLAAGLGMARFSLPREVWPILPGSVPYISFDTNCFKDETPLNVVGSSVH